MPNHMIRRQLKIFRNQNSLSQQQVADVLGVNRSTYCSYETGRRDIDIDTLFKLADFYKMPVDKFFEKRIPSEYIYDDDYFEGQPDTRYLSQLSKEEREIIVKFRMSDTEQQKEFLNFLSIK